MSESEFEALEPDIEAALRVEKVPGELPAGLRARLWSRIEASVAVPPVGGGGGGGGASDPTGSAVSTPGGSAASMGPTSWLALGLAAGAALGAGGYAALVPVPEAEVREVIVEVPGPAPVQQPEAIAPLPEPPEARVPAPRPARPLAAQRPPPETSTVEVHRPEASGGEPAPGSGSVERNLITRAQTALARGRPGDALDVLAQHAGQFPTGSFAEEREALWIQALLVAGRGPEARTRAQHFARRYPRSIFREAVEPALSD